MEVHVIEDLSIEHVLVRLDDGRRLLLIAPNVSGARRTELVADAEEAP